MTKSNVCSDIDVSGALSPHPATNNRPPLPQVGRVASSNLGQQTCNRRPIRLPRGLPCPQQPCLPDFLTPRTASRLSACPTPQTGAATQPSPKTSPSRNPQPPVHRLQTTDLLELDHNPPYEQTKHTITTQLEPRCAPCHRARYRTERDSPPSRPANRDLSK